jgi:hypothetical protein
MLLTEFIFALLLACIPWFAFKHWLQTSVCQLYSCSKSPNVSYFIAGPRRNPYPKA